MNKILIIIGTVILLLSCSGSPPEVTGSEWMLVYTYDLSRGGIYTELDFFLQLNDEDGLSDISEISISKDDQGWAWNLNPGNWTVFSRDDEDWIGANGLTRGGDLPRGEYRTRVTDRSGQKEDYLFRIDNSSSQPRIFEFPRAQITGEYLRVDTNGRDPVVLWFYNEKGELVAEKYCTGGLYRKDELLKSEEIQIVKWFMLYHQDEEAGFGMKSGPYLLE